MIDLIFDMLMVVAQSNGAYHLLDSTSAACAEGGRAPDSSSVSVDRQATPFLPSFKRGRAFEEYLKKVQMMREALLMYPVKLNLLCPRKTHGLLLDPFLLIALEDRVQPYARSPRFIVPRNTIVSGAGTWAARLKKNTAHLFLSTSRPLGSRFYMIK